MADRDATPPGLSCPACGATHAAGPGQPWRRDCGHTPWRFDATPRPAGSRPDPADLDCDRGLWAFEAFLPVESRVTLGEGVTPLVDAPPVGGDYRYTVRRIITIGPTPASRITETGRPTRRSRGSRGRSDR